ncbi:MAG TPA: CDP-diacylglycerol--glycerol-3-phosphate 3-phosphatidyltransferase [Methylomirabilota bacterium]|nr:CDP-diacylglycerol--glycerol-3-phosphate 3-phosphatidyltransferase [Methylomirabilota bacterium]
MNLPNQLTVSRFVLTLVFLVALFAEFPFHHTAALVVFIAAALTDWMDGRIARRRGLITNFGILMDPLADKILTCSAFIAFVGQALIPAWMVVVIVARELAITGLRLLAASKHVVLAAEGLGKHKTASQVTTIIATLVFISYPDWGVAGQAVFGSHWLFARPWVCDFVWASQWVAIILTFLSGWFYLWRNRELFLRDM